jgi:hypothetical protein
MDWFFDHIGLVIIIITIISFICYIFVFLVLMQGLSDGTIAHGLGNFWYQVEQGANGK